MKGLTVVTRSILLLTVVACTSGASVRNEGHRPPGVKPRDLMYGGVDAQPGEFPFVVSVKNAHPLYEHTHECAAVIVDETHLVTSGQCVHYVNLRDLEIVAGLYNITDYTETTQQLRKLKRAQKHPDYTWSPYFNDVAVLTVYDPFVWSDYVQPIKLPTATTAKPTGSCITLGWSQAWTSEGQYFEKDILQKLEVDTYPFADCQEQYSQELIETQMICTNSVDKEGNLVCSSEDGGPLLCQDEAGETYLAGVESMGFYCESQRPTVYTQVSAFLSFVNDELTQ